MKYLTIILALAVALAVSNSALRAQEVEGSSEKPAVSDDSDRSDRCGKRRAGKRAERRGCGMCRNERSQEARRGRGGRRGGGGGGRGPGAGTKPVKPATPAYLKRLQTALESELYARDYYAAAALALPGVRRFSNLTRAEANHAAAVTSAMTKLGGKPVQQQKVAIVVPLTVQQADAHCTEIELYVIEMYKGLIKDCPDDGVKEMLKRIQKANYRHLQVVGG